MGVVVFTRIEATVSFHEPASADRILRVEVHGITKGLFEADTAVQRGCKRRVTWVLPAMENCNSMPMIRMPNEQLTRACLAALPMLLEKPL